MNIVSAFVQDFLEVTPSPAFDAALMNPPFQGGQDMAHVTHASPSPAGTGTPIWLSSMLFSWLARRTGSRSRSCTQAPLCQVLFGGLPEISGVGMWCICAEIDDVALCHVVAFKGRRSPGNAGFQPVADSPAPEWRRPTLDELSQIVEGRTPPAIVKWTRFEAWGE